MKKEYFLDFNFHMCLGQMPMADPVGAEEPLCISLACCSLRSEPLEKGRIFSIQAQAVNYVKTSMTKLCLRQFWTHISRLRTQPTSYASWPVLSENTSEPGHRTF